MKRVLAGMLCCATLSTSILAAPWPSWAKDAYTWGQSQSISDELLSSADTVVTRAAAAQLLYEANGSPAVTEACPFSDVTGSAADAITWAEAQGYVAGVGNGRYAPARSVTRQEFASILWRWAGKPTPSQMDLSAYDDMTAVATWSQAAVVWCVQAGILQGRSTDQLVPNGTITMAEALTMLQRATDLPDVSSMDSDLQALTGAPRPIGSDGEATAVSYLQKRFTELGYQVTLQPYTDNQGRTGQNVIAIKPAATPNGDILLLTTHHDSVPTAYGANDNASGVAALLYAAEALQNLPGDTEIRFISFTDEENGKNGSRAYTASLPEAERQRIVGDIQFDMLGGLGTSGTTVCTMDGEANWVSDLLQQQDPTLERNALAASDHASLQLAGIPSVMLSQDGQGYLYHSAADTAEQLNLYAIAQAAQTAVSAVEAVLSTDTPSYQSIATQQCANYTYRQTRQTVIYFGSSLDTTEAYIGAAGQLVDTYEQSGDGWTDQYEVYRYSMRWFDGSAPINTYYHYRNGFLDHIELRPEETGYTFAQVQSLLEAMFGKPTQAKEGSYGWADPIYSKYISLTTDGSGCLVTVSNYSEGITNVLSSYTVDHGQASISDPEDAAVWQYLCSILPLEARQSITEFNLFTDGYSNVLAYTSPIQEDGVTDNSRFSINIDYYDVYDENGIPRDWSKLTYTILHEYGHVLLEDETQVDLSVGSNTHDPAGYVEGSFRKAFYDRFWKSLGDTAVEDYEKHPTHYVSRYGANYFHEDIADTFAVFVLGGKPDGTTVAEEKLACFWADPQMIALRASIRCNLGLDWPLSSATTEPPTGGSDPITVTSMEALKEQLLTCLNTAKQPPTLDVSSLSQQEDLPMAVKNTYFSILSEYPQYKYAYDIVAELTDDGLLRCTISYMPYRTGAYPADFQGKTVGNLSQLLDIAQQHLSSEEIPIRITDPTLTVDAMNMALQQVGGSYFLCQLNQDGTAIQVTPMNGLNRTEAQQRLKDIDALAKQVCAASINNSMSTMERAQALHAYLAEHVKYDFRYYSDPAAMPYDSITAYGALHDHLAICGGYAQALQALFQEAGIPCITVSGQLGRENHMWNLANIDGELFYFDATNDRNNGNYRYLYNGVSSEALIQYTWDEAWVQQLAADVL